MSQCMLATLDLLQVRTSIRHVLANVVLKYYFYHSTGGDKSKVYYDSDWATNDYFVSSSTTAYSMSLIGQVDSQILIGQLSYKQISDIFNHVHSRHQIATTG